MLKGISPILSPDLLHALCSMGQGDEIVLADAHFPANAYSENVLRADGIRITDLLNAILPLFELDQYSEFPLTMMQAEEGDKLDPKIKQSYRKCLAAMYSDYIKIARIERLAFYEHSKKAFVVVLTGELANYGNIILKKGVIQ